MESDTRVLNGATKPLSPLLALSSELRNIIYDYALSWPDLSVAFQEIEGSLSPRQSVSGPLCSIPKPRFSTFGELRTPTILLLNRQITSEALEILREKPLILTRPPPYVLQLAKPMDITEFIPEATLQKLRKVVLEMNFDTGDAQYWLKMVELLLDVWCEETELESMVVRARYVPPSTPRTFLYISNHRHVMGLLSRVSDSA